MGYMFRLLLSHLQTLKEYRSNYQERLNALWDPQCLQNYFVNIGDPTVRFNIRGNWI